MDKQPKLNKLQSFDFFYKRDRKIDLAKAKKQNMIGIFSGIFCVFIIFVSDGYMSKFHMQEKSEEIIKFQNSISTLSVFQKLSSNLEKKDWLSSQLDLKNITSINSSQVDNTTLSILSDYATKNFKNKPYTNEFSLLIIDYLISLHNRKPQELVSIDNLTAFFNTSFLRNDKIKQFLNNENIVYKKQKEEIINNAKLLINGLAESKTKKLLLENY